MSLTIEVAGRALQLLPERAALLVDEGRLLVADAHFGKAQAFRRLGVPVPAGTTAQNLQTLTKLISRTGARSITFLGDLLHARHGRGDATLAAVAAWRQSHRAIRMTLVRGNHDSHAGDPPADWQIEVVDEPLTTAHDGALAFCHHPTPLPGRYVIAGHIHPAALVGRGINSLRLPCFHFAASVGVLPAFGAFTGGHTVSPRPEDRVFLVVEDEIRCLPGLQA
jgi:uncharacterized protein